jgi:hypothetical protein
MDEKVKLTNVKIIITMGVYLTHGLDPKPSEPRGHPASPTPWLAGQGLRWFGPSYGCHASTQGGEARVGGESQWSESVVAAPPGRPVTTWHQTDLSKSVKVNTPHSTCSSPLVNVLV